MNTGFRNLDILHHVISSIVPLNFTIKDVYTNKISILNSIELPEDYKEILYDICERMHKKISLSVGNNIYYFEDKSGLRYMGVGVFNNSKHNHTVVLGPYLNHKPNNFMDNKTIDFNDKISEGTINFSQNFLQVLYDDQEKIIANVALSLSNNQINENNFINLESDDGHRSLFTYKDYKKNLVDIKQRYDIEKEFLQYMSYGDEVKSLNLIDKLSPKLNNLLPRLSLRNTKNLLLSFNSLYRKSIEENNIDYFCLHITSKKFEEEIENIKNEKDARKAFTNMISGYCNLLKDYNNNQHSKIVSNAINYIRLNSKRNISLETISKELYVHKTYLAKKFKEETNKTTSQYINEVRIEEAKFMILNTDYSIEYIGNYVGYNDIKYFSKIFKKIVNKSPREYRNYKNTTHK